MELPSTLQNLSAPAFKFGLFCFVAMVTEVYSVTHYNHIQRRADQMFVVPWPGSVVL
jgi:hypothetical protein